jgi:hypothetical protein
VLRDKCYVCVHVIDAARPVLYVCREGEDLVFSCGGDDHAQSTEDWKVLHRSHVTGADGTTVEVVDLADGEQAERAAIGEPWTRGPIAG